MSFNRPPGPGYYNGTPIGRYPQMHMGQPPAMGPPQPMVQSLRMPVGQPQLYSKPKRRREVSSDVVYYDYDYSGSEDAATQQKAAAQPQNPEQNPVVQDQNCYGYGYNDYSGNGSIQSQPHGSEVQYQSMPNDQSMAYANYADTYSSEQPHNANGQYPGYGYDYNYSGNSTTQPQTSQQPYPVSQEEIGGYYKNNPPPPQAYSNTPEQSGGGTYVHSEYSKPYIPYSTPTHGQGMGQQSTTTPFSNSAPDTSFTNFQTNVGHPIHGPLTPAATSAPIHMSSSASIKHKGHFKTPIQTTSKVGTEQEKKASVSVNYANYGQVDKPLSREQISGGKLPDGKSKVCTGIVTQLQDSFGMIGDDIFFQKSVVKGPCPKLGDRVLVEAESVSAMPFKWNSKRVQLVNKDLNINNYNSIEKTGEMMGTSHGVIKVAPPPPSISSGPLKSILKNSNSMARNPPPPPSISKPAKSFSKPPNQEKYNPDSPEPVDFLSTTFTISPKFSDPSLFRGPISSAIFPPSALTSYLQPKRSPSPRRSNRSPSPIRSRRSPSPIRSRRSPSPLRSRRSPSPLRSRRSPSPLRSRRSPSPRRIRRSISPRRPRRSRSPSPRRSRRSRSPSPRKSRHSRSPSPRRRRRSSSARRSRRSPSPTPTRYRRSPSPKRIKRSPSLDRKKRSPSPKYSRASPDSKNEKKTDYFKTTLGDLVLGGKKNEVSAKNLSVAPSATPAIANSSDSVAQSLQIASSLGSQNKRQLPIRFPIRAPAPRVPLLPNPAYATRPPPLVPYEIPSVLPNPLHSVRLSANISINPAPMQPPPPGVAEEIYNSGSLSQSRQPPPPGVNDPPYKSNTISSSSSKHNTGLKQQMMVTPMKKYENNNGTSFSSPSDVKNKSKEKTMQTPAYVVKEKSNTGENKGGNNYLKINPLALSANLDKVLSDLRKKVDAEKLLHSKNTKSAAAAPQHKKTDDVRKSSDGKGKDGNIAQIDKNQKRAGNNSKHADADTNKIWITDFSKICVPDIEVIEVDNRHTGRSGEEDLLHQTFLDEEQRLITKGDWEEVEKLREEEDKRLRFYEERRLRDLRGEEAKLIRTGAPQKEIEEFKRVNGTFETRWAEEQRLIKIREEEERRKRDDPEDEDDRRWRRRMTLEKEKELRRQEYKRIRQKNEREFVRSVSPARPEKRAMSVEKEHPPRSRSPYKGPTTKFVSRDMDRVYRRSRSPVRPKVEYRERRISGSPPRKHGQRSRRVSYEEYRRSRLQRSSRSRSRELEYEEFVERHDFSPPKSGRSGERHHEQEIDVAGLARAMEMVRRKQEELDQREREIEARMKNTDSLFARRESDHRDDRVQRYRSDEHVSRDRGGRY